MAPVSGFEIGFFSGIHCGFKTAFRSLVSKLKIWYPNSHSVYYIIWLPRTENLTRCKRFSHCPMTEFTSNALMLTKLQLIGI